MPREQYIRAAVAIAASRLLPSSVRDAVIADPNFTESLELKADAIVRFGRDDLAFERSGLFDAIRRALDPALGVVQVDNTLGETWSVCVTVNRTPVEISVERGTARLLMNHFGLLSSDKNIRLGTLLREADNFCLRPEEIGRWRHLLEERMPTDDEVVLIQNDFKDTPVAVANIIRENLTVGSVSLDAWVPRSAQYYERLVGKYENDLSVNTYAKEILPQQLGKLLQWRGAEGLKLALLVAPQPDLCAALSAAEIPDDTLADVLSWLADRGDPLSYAAAIEVALPRSTGSNELEDRNGAVLPRRGDLVDSNTS